MHFDIMNPADELLVSKSLHHASWDCYCTAEIQATMKFLPLGVHHYASGIGNVTWLALPTCVDRLSQASSKLSTST